MSKFLLTVFELAATFFVCQGLYAAADLTDLLLANCGEEVRANRTLTTLLNKLYKVFIVVLGVMTMAQETGLPVGSIVASAGLVGLTISLAAQDSAKNLFSGLVILLDRPVLHRRLDHRGRCFRRGGGHQLPLHQGPRTG